MVSGRTHNRNMIVRKLFPAPLLIALLAISIITNVILVVRLREPALWDQLRLSFVSPPTLSPTDHVRGDPQAKVTVFEYGDFQCPFCARFHTMMLKVTKETDVRWVFRHFPLDAIHPYSREAARASECAGEQNRFWEYADALYREQKQIGRKPFSYFADKIGLNVTKFKTCLKSGKYTARIDSQYQDGLNKRVSGTPTVYVNSKRFNALPDYTKLKTAIEQAQGP